MCDEYEDERMWAFWKRLEQADELRREDQEDGEADRPLLPVLPESPATRKPVQRPLVR